MDTKKLLSEAIEQRFKAKTIISALIQQVKHKAESDTFAKYYQKKLFLRGMEFELIGVKADFSIYDEIIPKIAITLAYIFVSKRKNVIELRDFYLENGKRFPHKKITDHFTESISYSIELDNVLNSEINLKIYNTKEEHEKNLAFEKEAASQNSRSFNLMAKTIKDYEKNQKK